MSNDNVIQNKSFEFALMIIAFTRNFAERTRVCNVKTIAYDPATSIGANVEEAMAASIEKRFCSIKMSISSKEARETRYWLRLLNKSEC
ncbi:MAG: four helix bundle protein [Gracilimonas sp.]|nr:four helix bundle protein [Gracilimonas sp.]